jgi:phosphoglycerate dehydrogenase-like enzyme
MGKPSILVATGLLSEIDAKPLEALATVYITKGLSNREVDDLLPSIKVLIVSSWPRFLTKDKVARMKQLKFVQSVLAGVESIPFGILGKEVIVSSNAGAYSEEVAEYAWGLILAAAKRIPQFHDWLTRGLWESKKPRNVSTDVRVLHGKTLGILGYGGIGRATASKAVAFGMTVNVFVRKRHKDDPPKIFSGRRGLQRMLPQCDVVVLALPLTRLTKEIVGSHELRRMRRNAILVNVGRAELVNQESLFTHLKANESFRYATDVWWTEDGRETFRPKFPFFKLPNIVVTPHVAGPSALAAGRPIPAAIENALRFLRSRRPRNVVAKRDYA